MKSSAPRRLISHSAHHRAEIQITKQKLQCKI